MTVRILRGSKCCVIGSTPSKNSTVEPPHKTFDFIKAMRLVQRAKYLERKPEMESSSHLALCPVSLPYAMTDRFVATGSLRSPAGNGRRSPSLQTKLLVSIQVPSQSQSRRDERWRIPNPACAQLQPCLGPHVAARESRWRAWRRSPVCRLLYHFVCRVSWRGSCRSVRAR